MPDGDKFERKLWGKGLRKVYRLACGGSELRDLIPLLHNAKNHLLRNGLDCPVIDKMGNLVHEAINRPLFSQEENTRWLSHQLDNLSARQGDSRGVRIAANAAKAIFAEMVFYEKAPKLKQVRKQIQDKFIAQLLDDQFFCRVRQGIMDQTNRNLANQLAWEERAVKEVLSYRRTSQRWVSSSNWDMERLTAPLTILEG